MKLAGISNGMNPIRGSFSNLTEDLVLDYTQGAHGRAFVGNAIYDLPDPRKQMVSVDMGENTVEITAPHGIGSAMGNINARAVKVCGDITLPVMRTQNLTLLHSALAVNELTGPANDDGLEPAILKSIQLVDSNLTCKGDLCFHNLEGDDRRVSIVKAPYMEGATTQGKLFLQADHLNIYVLEAQEVQVNQPAGCRVGDIHCDNVFQKTGLGTKVRISATKDAELAMALQSLMPTEFESESPVRELDAQGFDL